MAYLIEDLTISRGVVSIAETINGVPGEYTDLGNSPNFEIQLSSEAVEHFENRTPGRHKDTRVVVSAGYDLLFVLDQISLENLRLFLAASLTGTTTLQPGKYLNREFAIRFTSDNRKGSNWIWEFWRCQISSDQRWNLLEGGSWARLWFRAKGIPELKENAGRPFFTAKQVLPYTYATWDPEGAGPTTYFSEDLLTVQFPKGFDLRNCLATIAVDKFYCEFTLLDGYWGHLGLAPASIPLFLENGPDDYRLGWFPGSLGLLPMTRTWLYYTTIEGVRQSSVGLYPEYPWVSGDVYGLVKNGTSVFLRRRDLWMAPTAGGVTADFAAAVPVRTDIVGELYVAAGTQFVANARLTATANFGQAPWAYDPPEGFEGVYTTA